MLEGLSIIYFAPGEWDELWRGRHEVASIFARYNKVLFVERRPYLRPTLRAFRNGDLKMSALRVPALQQISEKLFVFRYPVWAPLSGRFPLNWLTKVIRRISLQNALRKLRMSNPISFIVHPDMVDLVNEMPSARLLIYHVFDEYSGYSGQTSASQQRIENREKRLLALADVVVVVSRRLYETKSPFNPHTYIVPNGVNYKAYASALADPYIPDDIKSIRRPRLGYSGLISDKVDIDMLNKLAQNNPDWSLVFVGEARVSKQRESWRKLSTMPNVYYLGLKDISEVPYYVKAFDVGLMPYVLNRQVLVADNPLKLYEYLAVGLPVASVDIPGVRNLRQYIHLADASQSFTQTVRAALADATPERCQVRRNLAAQNTWEDRVEQLSDVIESHLEPRSVNKHADCRSCLEKRED
jgi:glycosyltransferase involved in cell wall biosynthesis